MKKLIIGLVIAALIILAIWLISKAIKKNKAKKEAEKANGTTTTSAGSPSTTQISYTPEQIEQIQEGTLESAIPLALINAGAVGYNEAGEPIDANGELVTASETESV